MNREAAQSEQGREVHHSVSVRLGRSQMKLSPTRSTRTRLKLWATHLRSYCQVRRGVPSVAACAHGLSDARATRGHGPRTAQELPSLQEPGTKRVVSDPSAYLVGLATERQLARVSAMTPRRSPADHEPSVQHRLGPPTLDVRRWAYHGSDAPLSDSPLKPCGETPIARTVRISPGTAGPDKSIRRHRSHPVIRVRPSSQPGLGQWDSPIDLRERRALTMLVNGSPNLGPPGNSMLISNGPPRGRTWQPSSAKRLITIRCKSSPA